MSPGSPLPRRFGLLAALVAANLLIGITTAAAATPSSGTVGPANNSSTAWDFAAVGPGVNVSGGVEFVCPPQYCDSYTLHVALPAADAVFYTNQVATLHLVYTWNSTGPDDMDI